MYRDEVKTSKRDSDMVELAGQVIGKLEAMNDAEFAEVALEAAE